MNTFNHDVKFRLAEIALIYGLHCLIRYHLANFDSNRRESERVQTYVRDTICNGGSLEWEH